MSLFEKKLRKKFSMIKLMEAEILIKACLLINATA